MTTPPTHDVSDSVWRMREAACRGSDSGYVAYVSLVEVEAYTGTWEHTAYLAEKAPGVLLEHELRRCGAAQRVSEADRVFSWKFFRPVAPLVFYQAAYYTLVSRYSVFVSPLLGGPYEEWAAYFNRGSLEWAMACITIRELCHATSRVFSRHTSPGGPLLRRVNDRLWDSLTLTWIEVMEVCKSTPGVRPVTRHPGVGVPCG